MGYKRGVDEVWTRCGRGVDEGLIMPLNNTGIMDRGSGFRDRGIW